MSSQSNIPNKHIIGLSYSKPKLKHSLTYITKIEYIISNIQTVKIKKHIL